MIKIVESNSNDKKLYKLKNGDTIVLFPGETLGKEGNNYIEIEDNNAKCTHRVYFDSWEYMTLVDNDFKPRPYPRNK